MKPNLLAIVLGVLSLPLGQCLADISTPLVETDRQLDAVSPIVKKIMEVLEQGELVVSPKPGEIVVVNGWTMPHPTQRDITRNHLQMQSTAITPYGWRAVPELISWLDHKEQYMRYIAVFSLQGITGIKPHFPHFGSPKDATGAYNSWYVEARDAWSKWYEQTASKK
jgi:hypothetical protein